MLATHRRLLTAQFSGHALAIYEQLRAEAGTRIVPALYSTTGGLVEGTPFTLCDADGAACDKSGKLRLTRPVDSRIKRPSADVGRDVLSQR